MVSGIQAAAIQAEMQGQGFTGSRCLLETWRSMTPSSSACVIQIQGRNMPQLLPLPVWPTTTRSSLVARRMLSQSREQVSGTIAAQFVISNGVSRKRKKKSQKTKPRRATSLISILRTSQPHATVTHDWQLANRCARDCAPPPPSPITTPVELVHHDGAK